MSAEKWKVRRVKFAFRNGGHAWVVIPPEADWTFPFSGSYWGEVDAFAYGFMTHEAALHALLRHLDRRRT